MPFGKAPKGAHAVHGYETVHDRHITENGLRPTTLGGERSGWSGEVGVVVTVGSRPGEGGVGCSLVIPNAGAPWPGSSP